MLLGPGGGLKALTFVALRTKATASAWAPPALIKAQGPGIEDWFQKLHIP